MARPIANTPIIKGEDAKRFQRNLIKVLSSALSSSEREKKKRELYRMEENYNKMVAASDGVFY